LRAHEGFADPMTAPRTWTKTKFKSFVEAEIGKSVAHMGFQAPSRENRSQLEKVTADYRVSISFLGAAGKMPNRISFMFNCAIVIPEVQRLLNQIRDPGTTAAATFLFPLNAIDSPESASAVDYVFDWTNEADLAKKLDTIKKKIEIVDRVAAALKGLDSLSKRNLGKVPHLGRRYADGLKADFAHCLPRIAALGQALEGDIAAANASIAVDGGLSDSEKERLRALVQELAGSAERARETTGTA
jgi:hypothetical protein